MIAVADIRPALGFVPDAVADALGSLALSHSRVGLVTGIYNRLLTACKNVELVSMDLAAESLRTHKSPLEFQLLREPAEIDNTAMEAMMKSAATEGTTEADAVAAAYNIDIRRGAAMIDAVCALGLHTAYYA